MQQIIKGILYDTEAAVVIDRCDFRGRSIDGMAWNEREILYRGPNGNYFMDRIVLRAPTRMLRFWHGWKDDWHNISPLTAEKATATLQAWRQARNPVSA